LNIEADKSIGSTRWGMII
jgi:hypothetical protein